MISQIAADAAATRKDLGKSVRDLSTLMEQRYEVAFAAERAAGGKPHVKASIDGVRVFLWGEPDATLESITILGSFADGRLGEKTIDVLRALLATFTPNWKAAEQDRWLRTAALRSDDRMSVFTVRDGVRISVVTVTLDGHALRVISLKTD